MLMPSLVFSSALPLLSLLYYTANSKDCLGSTCSHPTDTDCFLLCCLVQLASHLRVIVAFALELCRFRLTVEESPFCPKENWHQLHYEVALNIVQRICMVSEGSQFALLGKCMYKPGSRVILQIIHFCLEYCMSLGSSCVVSLLVHCIVVKCCLPCLFLGRGGKS